MSKGLKVAVIAGHDVGGTCVNRGCVPSKALLAASGRVREIGDEKHLADMGITTGGVTYDREKVAAHANNLASKVAKNLGGSLAGLGVDTFMEKGELASPTTVKLVGTDKVLSAKNVILATGSVPFVPPGVEQDGKTVFTSDEVAAGRASRTHSSAAVPPDAVLGCCLSDWSDAPRLLPLTAADDASPPHASPAAGAEARVGARLHRNRRLWLHRPRVLRRVHCAWLRGAHPLSSFGHLACPPPFPPRALPAARVSLSAQPTRRAAAAPSALLRR